MKVKDVAERLEVGVSTVYQLIAEGRLDCDRHGVGRGTIRVSEEQLAEYRAAGRPEKATARPRKWITVR